MLKISLLFKKKYKLYSIILTIKNAKLSEYYFYMNLNIWGDSQICIRVLLSDSEDSTGNKDVGLLKFIENIRKVVDGNSKDVAFSEGLEALKVLSPKKIEQIASEELSMTKKNRKEYGELYFYTNELMFGPPITEGEKISNPFSLILK